MSATDTTIPPRRPWIAFILSLLMPGLGQFYCGRWLGAVLFYVPLLTLAFLHRWAVSLEWPASTNLAIVCATVALFVAAAMEAAVMAHRAAAFQPTTFNRWYFYLPAIVWSAILIPAIATLYPYRIPSAAMEPTLMPGDHVLAASYGFPMSAPARCDIAVFVHEEDGRRVAFVKRVVALAGERVALQNGRLIVAGVVSGREKIGDAEGGTIYRETLLPGGCTHAIEESTDDGPLDNMDFVLVPAGTVFVLGDNRDDSMDSRTAEIGFVPLSQFRSKVILIYAAKDSGRIGPIDN